MTDGIERSLKEFSEKHGAVLLGMHHELQAMQQSIDKSEHQIAQAQNLASKAEQNLQAQRSELQKLRDELATEIRLQLAAARNDLRTQASRLQTQQAQANALYEKSLALLAEQKQRELNHQRRMLQISRAIFVAVLAAVISIWVVLWLR